MVVEHRWEHQHSVAFSLRTKDGQDVDFGMNDDEESCRVVALPPCDGKDRQEKEENDRSRQSGLEHDSNESLDQLARGRPVGRGLLEA